MPRRYAATAATVFHYAYISHGLMRCRYYFDAAMPTFPPRHAGADDMLY